MLIFFFVKALLSQPEVYLGCFILGRVMQLLYAEESQKRLQEATHINTFFSLDLQKQTPKGGH